MNVLLVHGFMNSGGVFRRLAPRLAARGHDVLAPSLKPRDARYGIADLGKKLATIADERFGADSPLAIVGFSMGGLVARYYVQLLGGHQRTRGLFIISSPLRGTLTAYLYPSSGVREMRPGSPLLSQLDAAADALSGVELHAYWTPLDLMIVPATSCLWTSARQTRVWSPLHALMPYNNRICGDICAQIDRLGAAKEVGGGVN